MKLVAVSVIKNEADIVEAFVRHHAAWVDHHLVFDHASTDGTREVLGGLVREGLRLTVFTDDSLAHLQQARSNHLTRLAAGELGADWVVLLDGDEFLVGPGRAELEQQLAAMGPTTPASLPLLNHAPTASDDPAELNPVLRLRHCERQPAPTRKILVPRVAALDPSLVAGKGSHALYRDGQPIPDAPLPDSFWLAHFPERSAGQQAARIMLAELQRLSRGRANAGMDFHYRLPFQTLAENPEMYFAMRLRAEAELQLAPLAYRGGPLRHTRASPEWSRPLRSILPFLEGLASSHGRLVDRAGPEPAGDAAPPMRPLAPEELTAATYAGRNDAFAGFSPREGWASTEGPVPNALLPAFHWGLAPASRLSVPSAAARTARLTAEMLTYSDGQKIDLRLNGREVRRHEFERVRQRERLECPLELRAGDNLLELAYAEGLQTTYDPRRLAVIFLSLRVT